MKWMCPIVLTVFLGAGCSSVPFEPTKYVSVHGLNPVAVREAFDRALPAAFRLENTVVFDFRGRSLSALGLAAMDRTKRTFTVVGLTHTGMKLFEITGEGENVQTHVVLPIFGEHGDFGRVVGEDVRRAHFDLVPPAGATVRKGKDRIVFSAGTKERAVEYEFAGTPPRLTEKRYSENGWLACSVSYYEYREEDGALFAGGIFLWNVKYDYTLTVRLKKAAVP